MLMFVTEASRPPSRCTTTPGNVESQRGVSVAEPKGSAMTDVTIAVYNLYPSVDAAVDALDQSHPDEIRALRIEVSRLRAQHAIDQQAIERLTEERDMLAQRRAAEVKELLALKHPAPTVEPNPIADAIAVMQRSGIR